jgi:hypothetical protein
MSENNSGAGAKGTAGYWGYSSDEKAEHAFEVHYRSLIPKGEYATSAHNPLSCKVCTPPDLNVIFTCPKGIGFGPLPTVTTREGAYKITKCALCGEIRSRRKIRHKRGKSLNNSENPILGDKS